MVIAVVALAILTAGLAACKKGSDGETSAIMTDLKGISWLIKPKFKPRAAWYMVTPVVPESEDRSPTFGQLLGFLNSINPFPYGLDLRHVRDFDVWEY